MNLYQTIKGIGKLAIKHPKEMFLLGATLLNPLVQTGCATTQKAKLLTQIVEREEKILEVECEIKDKEREIKEIKERNRTFDLFGAIETKIENKFGVSILTYIKDPSPLINGKLFADSLESDSVKHLNYGKLSDKVLNLYIEMSKYSSSIFKEVGLDCIYLLDSLKHDGKPVDGVQFGDCIAFPEPNVFHHEFFHIVDIFDGGLENDDSLWIKETGYKPEKDWQNVRKVWENGSFTEYSFSSTSEDQAEVAQNLFSTRKDKKNYGDSTTLNKKIDLIKEVYFQVSKGRMNDDYWKRLAQGKDAVKIYSEKDIVALLNDGDIFNIVGAYWDYHDEALNVLELLSNKSEKYYELKIELVPDSSRLKTCEEALEKYPNSLNLNMDLVSSYWMLEDFERAVQHINQLMNDKEFRSNPFNAETMLQGLVYAFQNIGDDKRALETYNRMIKEGIDYNKVDMEAVKERVSGKISEEKK